MHLLLPHVQLLSPGAQYAVKVPAWLGQNLVCHAAASRQAADAAVVVLSLADKMLPLD